MARSKLSIAYIDWRDGKPRTIFGPRERRLGFKQESLRHPDGSWFTYEQTRRYVEGDPASKIEGLADRIASARNTGAKPKQPPAARGKAVKDLWRLFTKSDEYLGSAEIKGLAPSTQANYPRFIKPLQDEPLWQAPVAALQPEILKGLHKKLMKARGLSMANAAIGALSSALTWGRLQGGWLPRVNGQTVANPAHNLRLPTAPVRIRVASETEMAALINASTYVEVEGTPLHAVGDGVVLAFYSGQRPGDVLALEEEGAVGDRVKLRQNKTGARISIPMAPRLIDRIAISRARRLTLGADVVARNIVINENTLLPYRVGTFGTHYRMVRDAAVAGIIDAAATAAAAERGQNEPVWIVPPCPSLASLHFADLRDTAVTWYARASCTVPEIASITGHSLVSIYTILKHYLDLDETIADNAVRKLVEWMERERLVV